MVLQILMQIPPLGESPIIDTQFQQRKHNTMRILKIESSSKSKSVRLGGHLSSKGSGSRCAQDDGTGFDDHGTLCPGCGQYIDDDDVLDPEYEIVVEYDQRWHRICLEEDKRINSRQDEMDSFYDPQEEMPSDRYGSSGRPTRTAGMPNRVPCSNCGREGFVGFKCKKCNHQLTEDSDSTKTPIPMPKKDVVDADVRRTANVVVAGPPPRRCPKCQTPVDVGTGKFVDLYSRTKCNNCGHDLSKPYQKAASVVTSQTIPSDGFADGGEEYTDEEMDLMDKEDSDDKPRKWHVKVTYDDGEVMDININGTKEEITRYYTTNRFERSDERSFRRGIKVEFVADLGEVPWIYYGESARPESAKQAKSLWEMKKISQSSTRLCPGCNKELREQDQCIDVQEPMEMRLPRNGTGKWHQHCLEDWCDHVDRQDELNRLDAEFSGEQPSWNGAAPNAGLRKSLGSFNRRAQETRYKRSHHPDTPPLYPTDPLARTVSDAGGALRYVDIPNLKPGENGGCGSPCRVEGTNGGEMPCGSMLSENGRKKPHYCPACRDGRGNGNRGR